MNNKVHISARLKKLRISRKYPQSYIAGKLAITQAAYSHIERGKRAVTAEHTIRLAKLYTVTTDFILTGGKNFIVKNSGNNFIPLIDPKAQADFFSENYKEDLDQYEYYRIPAYEPTKENILIKVVGDNMHPTFISGDILMCRFQKPEKIVDGTIAVIVTEGEFFATRLFKHPDENFFWIVSDHLKNKIKREIRKSQILQLFQVLGKVSITLFPTKEKVTH